MPATLTGANSATSHSADVVVDDQTRSWSSRIANTEDPFVQRKPNMHGNLQNMRVSSRQQRVVGNAVEERRTDGDRHTQMMSATEWLRAKDANNNGTVRAPRGAGPPVLPRTSYRDHLSERNRDTVLYDPARPHIEPLVRVTGRQSLDDCSAQGRRRAYQQEEMANRERARQLEMERQYEAERAAEANELLELRSMGIRSIIAQNEQHGPNAARSPVVTRSTAAKKAAARGDVAPAPTPMEAAALGAIVAAAAPAPVPGEPLSGWGHAREAFNPKKPIFIDGKPLSIDLEWITGPLERKIEGFRGSPPKVREGEAPKPGQDPWGPVPFTMPASKQTAYARRAHPVRASG